MEKLLFSNEEDLVGTKKETEVVKDEDMIKK